MSEKSLRLDKPRLVHAVFRQAGGRIGRDNAPSQDISALLALQLRQGLPLLLRLGGAAGGVEGAGVRLDHVRAGRVDLVELAVLRRRIGRHASDHPPHILEWGFKSETQRGRDSFSQHLWGRSVFNGNPYLSPDPPEDGGVDVPDLPDVPADSRSCWIAPLTGAALLGITSVKLRWGRTGPQMNPHR